MTAPYTPDDPDVIVVSADTDTAIVPLAIDQTVPQVTVAAAGIPTATVAAVVTTPRFTVAAPVGPEVITVSADD